MQAVAVPEFREVPRLMDLPEPSPGPGELLVRVEAASINPFDAKIANGLLAGSRRHVFPLVLGVDAAGSVESVGPGVSEFRTGDRILGTFLHDPVGTGTYAWFTTVPETNAVVRVPTGMSAEEAASLPTAGMTALHAIESLQLPPASSVLIVGASGGVGSFAVELAHAQGLHVAAVARAGSSDRLRALGAELVVDPNPSTAPHSLAQVRPEGFDGLLDLMSDGPGFLRWSGLVRKGGSAATTTYSADPGAAATAGIRAFNIDMQPSAPLLQRLITALQAGRLDIPVQRRIRLSEAPTALAELRAGSGRGKVVIGMSR